MIRSQPRKRSSVLGLDGDLALWRSGLVFIDGLLQLSCHHFISCSCLQSLNQYCQLLILDGIGYAPILQ